MLKVLAAGSWTTLPCDERRALVLPPGAVWIDMVSPSRDEELALETLLGLDLPTREEMAEIEASSRLYREDDAVFMTAFLLAQSEADIPSLGPVTFVLAGGKLITIRYIEPKAFAVFCARVEREPELAHDAPTTFVGLLDALIDRLADILERTSAEIEVLSTEIFTPTRKVQYRTVVKSLGRSQNINGKARDSLVSLARLIGFAGLGDSIEKDPHLREQLTILQRDVASLTEHSGHLAANVTFLLDGALGLINIEQNAIIKFFSVAAVIFLPPTLVASYFGMNFEHMAEFDWAYGEAFALGLMAVSIIVPLWWFKRRGWL